jgi:hypothetical protein
MVDLERFTATHRRLDHPVHAKLLELHRYWMKLAGGAAFPPREAIDAMAIPNLLGNLILVDVLSAPLDFRYRLMGEEVVKANARGLKGRTVRDLIRDDPNQQGVFDGYAHVAATGQPYCALVTYENVMGAVKRSEMAVLPLGNPPEVSVLLIGLVYLPA